MAGAKAVWTQGRGVLPGLLAAAALAAAAATAERWTGLPAAVAALALGMALGRWLRTGAPAAGVALSGRLVLRIGVAVLGLKISAAQVAGLGWAPFAVVGVSVVATLALTVLAARALGFGTGFGFLAGGATVICGASAALAIAAVLAPGSKAERATGLVVIGVSLLSTLAMVTYPALAASLGLTAAQAGAFLGGSIHDVAQVVAAGYGVSPAAGDAAAVVKLARVGLLGPVVLAAALLTRGEGAAAAGRAPGLPWFAVAFVALAAVNSFGVIPAAAQAAAGELSRACLLMAIVAVGAKTTLAEVRAMGPAPLVLLTLATALLGGCVLAGVAVWG